MRVRPTPQPGYGAASRNCYCNRYNIFKKKVYSCVGISTAINGSFGLRPASLLWPLRSSPISVASLISTSKTGVHFKLCFLFIKAAAKLLEFRAPFSFSFETRTTQILCRAVLVFQPIQSPKVFHLAET